MDKDSSRGSSAPLARNASALTVTRRTVIGGIGTMLASRAALGAEPDDDELLIEYADEARNAVTIRFKECGAAPLEPTSWKREQFGPGARFAIVRESAIVPPKPNVANTLPPPVWRAVQWRLTVEGASFPGGVPHRAEFVFERSPDKLRPSGLGPWTIRLETTGWPQSQDQRRQFGGFTQSAVGTLDLKRFLTQTDADSRLAAPLDESAARTALEGFFGKRIENDGFVQVGLDARLTWWVRALDTSHLYILAIPLKFKALRVERTFGNVSSSGEATAGAASKACPSTSAAGATKAAAGSWQASPQCSPRLLADAAPPPAYDTASSPSAGLYGEVIEEPELPRRDKVSAFELCFLGAGEDRVGFDLTITDIRSLRAALRHWGKPDRTVAGLTIGDRDQPLKTIGRLELLTAESERYRDRTAFEFSALEIVRQKDSTGRVLTDFRGTPSGKEHVIRTPFGSAAIRAAPPVSPEPGRAARVPRMHIQALDRATNDQRLITAFEAPLSLVSLGVCLPESTALEKRGDHVTRLEFDDADIRFVLPALGEPKQAVLGDAVIPIAFRPSKEPQRRAFIDLARARLTVLRPGDLLSLSYRFSGLTLDLPVLNAGPVAGPARVVPGFSPRLCRPASRTESDAVPTRDERPLLIVEFPPQHVAEQAIHRQIATPELPVLAQLDSLKGEDANALARLRGRRPRRREDPKGYTPTDRLADRRRIETAIPADDPNLTAFRKSFAEETERAKLPSEQRIYLGPEFLDDDARKIALRLLRTPTPKTPVALGTPPDVALPDDAEAALYVQHGRKVGDPFDPAKPEDWPLSDDLERAKERRDFAYAEFRAAFEHRVRQLQPDDQRTLGQYRGASWFAAKPVRDQLNADITRWTRNYKRPVIDDTIPNQTEARLSGPSRLAFRVNCDDFQSGRKGGGFDFSLEALTNWGAMDLAVVRRAERLFVSPERGPMLPRWNRVIDLDEARNLAFQGISRGDHLAVAEDKSRKGLAPDPTGRALGMFVKASRVTARQRLSEVASAAREAPDLFQTAIELPFRLFLSPAQDSTWLTPNTAVHRKVFGADKIDMIDTCRELWSATLGGTGVEAGVRAVWSPDFRPEALLSTDAPGAPPSGAYAPWSLPRGLGSRSSWSDLETLPRFVAPLDAADRHEIVALSSLHGLPVLGRRDTNGEILGGSQYDPPDGFRLDGMDLNAPPPKGGQPAVSERDYSAIYRPQPLSVLELSLTALGGNLNLDTTFTPPASAKLKGRRNLFDAFTIERWRHRTVLGRDVVVEVVYKGFLFPIGHKATLVKVTERRIEANANGSPIAVLIQRKLLRIGEPVKAFPAYDHPNEGRRWPCERITMLTRRTPDLVDPDDAAGGRIVLPNAPGRIFWPRTARGPDGAVRFQMLIDDEAVPVAMPLIFVDSAAANDAATMKNLVDWYNGTSDAKTPAGQSPDRVKDRRLPRRGQPVRMAPASKPGDTSFETDWWDIKAEGRESRTDPPAPKDKNADALSDVRLVNRKFDRDPFMEGLDQPAFYPVLDAARCRLTPIERFTGRPDAWAVVSYDGYYAAYGFGEPAKDGEIAAANEVYLRLISGYGGQAAKPLRMEMQSGDRSGGVGQPNLDVVGLSRAIGPIGQSSISLGSKGEVRPADVSLGVPSRDDGANGTSLPSLSVHTAKPDPASMFPADAKLLGLVPLALVLEASTALKKQPILKEVVEYGAAAGRSSGAEARSFISQQILAPIRKVVGDLETTWTAIAAKDLKLSGDATVSLENAYPQLGRALGTLKQQIDDALSGTASDVEFFADLAVIYEAGRALVDTFTRILRDPLASVSEAQTAKLKQVVEQIRQVADGIPALVATAKSQLVDVVVSQLGSALRAADVRTWRRTLFTLPRPSTSFSGSQEAAYAKAVDEAFEACLAELLANLGTMSAQDALTRLPQTLASKLREASAASNGAVQDALQKGAARIIEQGGAELSSIAAPRLGEVADDVQRIIKAGTRLGQAVTKSAVDAVAALAETIPSILDAAADLLGGAAVAPIRRLSEGCQKILTLLADLADALLPAADSNAADAGAEAVTVLTGYERAVPKASDAKVTEPPSLKPGDTIGGAEICQAFMFLAGAFYNAETSLAIGSPSRSALQKQRQALATQGRRCAAAIVRLQEARPQIADWRRQATTGCTALPDAVIADANSLIAARHLLLDELHAFLAGPLGATQALASLSGANTGAGLGPAEMATLRNRIADGADALRVAALAAIRFQRATTLLGTVLLPGEGANDDASNRKQHLIAAANAFKAIAAGLPANNPLVEAATALDTASTALQSLEATTRKTADGLRKIVVGRGLDDDGLNDLLVKVESGLNAAKTTATELQAKVTALEGTASDVATRLIVVLSGSIDRLDDRLGSAIKPLADSIDTAYSAVIKGRRQLLDALKAGLGDTNDPLLRSILKLVVTDRLGETGSPFVVPCTATELAVCKALVGYDPQDRLALEASAIRNTSAKLGAQGLLAARDTLIPAFIPYDPNRELALAVLVQQFSRVNADFIRTLVLSAIDLKAAKREIESRIRDLVPARFVLPYDLDNALKNFPDSDPIFIPRPNTNLTLRARTTVHLLPDQNGQLQPPEFTVTGDVGPFGVKLLGDAFDVVTVNFTGLNFQAGSGRSPSFAVRFKDVAIGSKASFLQPLSDFLTPKAGGFYLKVLDDRPGLEAGYGINLGIIGVGTLSFSNVLLSAAARLPFDSGGEARFLVSIGRSDAPFLISSTIFGGGGYLALIANSRAIVGFEASFDYGGVAAFGFGPLQGIGRITMGIYLRKSGDYTSLGATFFAGGAAHIACFGFSTSLLVRLTQNDGGPMYGSATYTFSFSLGIHDIDFEVTVEKNAGTSMGSQGDQALNLHGRPTAFAALNAERIRSGATGRRVPLPPSRPTTSPTEKKSVKPPDGPAGKPPPPPPAAAATPRSTEPRLNVTGVSQAENWEAYGNYFDDTLRPAGVRGAAR